MNENEKSAPVQARSLISALAWVVALLVVACAAYLAWQTLSRRSQSANTVQAAPAAPTAFNKPSTGSSTSLVFTLPEFKAGPDPNSINRKATLHTFIPSRTDQDVHDYVVVKGDSVFGIAHEFNIKPETVLWANYAQLNDNPDMISIGMQLKIPTVNGVLYQWQAGDTLDAVAGRFKATVADILGWSPNQIDLTDPKIDPGTSVMIPNGQREFRQWLIPTIPRGSAGVLKSVYGAGACEGNYSGANGSGAFIWPASNHVLSGNDYWSGHLGIDIAAGEGAPILAADSGVVVFAGWANGGYGNMVMIDHGNGYQTLYAHLTSVNVSCGRSVSQGTQIGYAGSTGNSTGPHLHFEVRYLGGFVNPWFVLPAP